MRMGAVVKVGVDREQGWVAGPDVSWRHWWGGN
jgi:hypothetical protein